MKSRRAFLLSLTSGLVALAVLAAPVIADELLGTITKVDVAGKKLSVLPKDADKEIEVTVTDDTEVVTPKGVNKIDLEKLAKGVDRAIEKGRKGVNAKITHENSKVSKIEYQAKKKAN
jgi:hypothetical protein